MSRRISVLVVLVGLIFSTGCGRQDTTAVEDPESVAYSAFRDAYLNSDNREDQVALVEAFISEWPNHKYAGYFAADIVGYYSDEVGDPQRAYDILAGVLQRAEDPEIRFWLGTSLAPVAASVGRDLDLAELIADLEAEGELDYDQAEQILTAAADLGDWELMDRWADVALARSTPEALRADYPGHEFEQSDAQRRSNHRRATALANKAWASYNLGQVDEALAAFEEANGLAETNYLGLTGTPLARYWGEALLREGDAARAISVVSRDAIFGDRRRAEPVLRDAWTAANGDVVGFADFVETARLELAPAIDDFTLTDYAGNPVSLNGVRQGKVTLLAFWFPT